MAKGHQMGVHFTNHPPQLGELVVAGFIVNASQDVFDGLRHDGRLPWSQIRTTKYGRVWAKYGRVGVTTPFTRSSHPLWLLRPFSPHITAVRQLAEEIQLGRVFAVEIF
jgi:hypothetical protein